MKKAITVPETMLPKREPGEEFLCECMFKPIKMTRRQGTVMWLKQAGASVSEGEPICDGDVEKKTVEFISPCAGVLAEICVPEGCAFTAGDVLGYVDEAE